MKLHRFYLDPKNLPGLSETEKGMEIILTLPDLTHQIRKVLKLQIGEKLVFFTGNSNEYLSSIVSYEGKYKMKIKIEEITKNEVLFSKQIHLLFSLIKKDNVDWILQKGTEVGVSHFIPMISARSEKKEINMERARKIIIEATEQCGRNIPPTLHEVIKLENVFDKFGMPFIVFEKDSPVLNPAEIKDNPIGLLVGPEGGWTKEELEMFADKKTLFRSLGPTVLRAETAAIVASAKLAS